MATCLTARGQVSFRDATIADSKPHPRSTGCFFPLNGSASAHDSAPRLSMRNTRELKVDNLCLFPIRRQKGRCQRSCVSAGHQGVMLPSTRNCSCPDGCGREALVQPLRRSPLGWRARWGRSEAVAHGIVGPVSEPGQETSHPHNIQLLPWSPCSPHLTAFPPLGFPAHSRFQLWCFPGKPGCWQTGRLSAGLALCQGPDTACAPVKAGGLKPTQAPLSQGKGGSTLNPGFVFRR